MKKKADTPMYFIWSHEHFAWWRAASQGYTTDLTQAGLYTREEVVAITLDHIPPGEEIAVLADIARLTARLTAPGLLDRAKRLAGIRP